MPLPLVTPHYANPDHHLIQCGATYFRFNDGDAALQRLLSSWGYGSVTLSCECGSREIPLDRIDGEPGSCPECAQEFVVRRVEPPKPAKPKAVRKRKAAKPRKRAARKRVADLAEGE